MCIRDRATCARLARGEGRGRLYCEVHTKCLPVLQFFKTKGYRVLGPAEAEAAGIPMPVSYTHLDDKKKREEVDIRNGADQMVFQTEKMLKENGDKMPADVKSEAEAKLADLKTAVQSGSIDEIKAKQDELSHVFEKMYQAAAAAQQAAGAQPGPDAGANNQQKPGDDGVVDADFKEV